MDSNIKYDWISLKKSVKAYLKSLFLADIYNVTWIVYHYIQNSFLSKMLVRVKFQNIAISSRAQILFQIVHIWNIYLAS